jgi:hypothetical protein
MPATHQAPRKPPGRRLTPQEAALTGADKKHPGRYQLDYVNPEAPLGNAPEHMSERGKVIWFEFQTYLPSEVLRSADRHFVEMTAEEFAAYRANPAQFPSTRLGSLFHALDKLGGSPLGRLKLARPKAPEKTKPEDSFEDL